MVSRLLFLVALVAALVGCSLRGAAPSSPPPRSDVSDLVSKTVALVEDGDAYCTGVWVGQSTIVTAAHCVVRSDEPLRAFVTRDDVFGPVDLHVRSPLRARPALVSAVDEEHDLALLIAPLPPAHGVARVVLDTRAGVHVRTMGHPLGLWFSYSSGEVAGVRLFDPRDEGAERVWVQATAPISPGNSGGGLFDDEGALVGIASGSFPRGQTVNLFVHPQYIDALLRKQPAL